ncbi:hypothetical protein HJG60_010110 [Phyllostomus discolor]|uniref:Uncharacterized protein n=1 Tax=Phyllostomus discolor TaxID=89673 RepID=A0A834AYP8_9CHIR|nr:hypothetical protein HJG60_010110 [Phyllostomus discolor]
MEKNISPEAAQAPQKEDNSKANMEQVARTKQTGPDDLDFKMAEFKGGTWKCIHMGFLFYAHNFTQSQEHQLVNKKTHPVSNNDEKIHCTTKDVISPEVILANQGFREPGQVKGREWPPTPKMLKLNRKLTNFVSNLEHGSHTKQIRSDDLKTKEADTKGEKVGEAREWAGGEMF